MLQSIDARAADLERRVGRLDKKLDGLARHAADERLLLKRLESVLTTPGVLSRRQRQRRRAFDPIAPIQIAQQRDWCELDRCAVCDHDTATVVGEYNRFVMTATNADIGDAIYNYSLCHQCGVVFAARRPVGARYRDLLGAFSENLGRASRAPLLLNPQPLSDEARADLERRLAHGALVSEHATTRKRDWLPGALRDRMSVAVHAELLGSLVPMAGGRVLEIRTRTGALGASLQRIYDCRVDALPMFETQQLVINRLYGIRAEALIDFEHFRIPYDGQYDVIISNHMITHAVRPREFLRTLAEALRPDGYLYLYNEPDEAEFLTTPQSMFNVLNPFHLQTFDGASLARALGGAGFSPLFVTHTDGNLVALFQKTGGASSVAMSDAERQSRLAAYAAARDYAILALPEDRRPIFAAEWDNVVARAVVNGQATIDEKGRIVFGRKLAATHTPAAH